MSTFRKILRIVLITTVAAVLTFFFAACNSMNSKKKSVMPAATATPEMLIVRRHPTETPKIYSDFELYMTEVVKRPHPGEIIRISGRDTNKYSRYVTTNTGTIYELTRLRHYVPSGNYTARNNRNYMDQLNVYSDRSILQDSIEYPADGQAYFFQPGESQQITVPDSYYIHIGETSEFELTGIPTRQTRQIIPPPTQQILNAGAPVYDSNNRFLGYIGDPTPTGILERHDAQAAAGHPAGCNIKGNVSKRNKDQWIYHCLNWRDYEKTDVNYEEGDRWFCSEQDAIAAGFRKPKNVSASCIP